MIRRVNSNVNIASGLIYYIGGIGGEINAATLVDKSLFRKDLVVADTVYNPEKTKMILEAEEAGCKAIGGAGMLLQQGAVNYELFVGKEMPLAEYQEFQKAQAK